MEKEQELLDKFATSAMEALISKMPIYDTKGQHGQLIDTDELTLIKKELTLTAYEYAGWMLIAREESKGWLKENEGILKK